MDENIAKLKQWVAESDNIVFFGGAGVSTESGIPDFRSVDGLYNQKWKYPPETILSHSFFERDPAEYYRFHREKLVIDGVKPNRAHTRLAELEQEGKLRAVITQNIDGLHQAAGSKNVLELHGSILRAYCSRCRKPYDADVINHGQGISRCSCVIRSAYSASRSPSAVGTIVFPSRSNSRQPSSSSSCLICVVTVDCA